MVMSQQKSRFNDCSIRVTWLPNAFMDERGIYVEATEVVQKNGHYFHNDKPVTRHTGKMGKSLKNAVNPDDVYNAHGADSMRLYEMSMGPLDVDRPWTTTGIAGMYRFLQRTWRLFIDEQTGELQLGDKVDDETRRLLHKTIAGVSDDMSAMRFNTAISKLIELTNHLTKTGTTDRETAETMTLMLGPLAPILRKNSGCALATASR